MQPHPLLTILILGTGLLAADPSGADARLLPEGTRPPVFTLPDGTGRFVSLRSFLSSRRIVVLFGPSASYLETVRAERAQFEERDLTVLAVVTPGSSQLKSPHSGPVYVLLDAEGAVTREYGAANGRPAFYLIGKDGHLAVARHGYPTPQELFGVIDAMPMRRQEMRERHQKG